MNIPAGASTCHLPPGHWLSVLDGLCALFPHIGRAQWLDRMQRARVVDRDGVPLDAYAPYRVGMRVHYWREVADEAPIPVTETVLHIDDQLVVADKPHFLPVIPAGAFMRETLLARLIARLDNPNLAPLHRLDRGTAGLVLFSANPATRGLYQVLFAQRRIHKRYEALAAPLAQHTFPLIRRSRLERGEPFFRMCEVAGEPNSQTRVEVLQRGETCWRYALYPHTGKKHQLRVHMAALGASIINDHWYPQLHQATADDHAKPLQLLARSLAFVDPLSGKERRFQSARELSGGT